MVMACGQRSLSERLRLEGRSWFLNETGDKRASGGVHEPPHMSIASECTAYSTREAPVFCFNVLLSWPSRLILQLSYCLQLAGVA